MKILYVEDQLTQNISSIIKIFGKYLGKKRIQKLYDLEANGYVTPNKIVEIIESSQIIDVAFTFEEALNKFLNNKYLLFIIDRNLAGEIIYEIEEIQKIYPKYTEKNYNDFWEREGDFLLELLVSENIQMVDNFYFLTANIKDELRNAESLQNHIDFSRFKLENIIEKGVEDVLISKVENFSELEIIAENKLYISFLETHFGEKTVEKFIELIKNKDESNGKIIFQNLTYLRNIFENSLTLFAQKNDSHNCWNPKNKSQLVIGKFIKWLRNYDDYLLENKYRHNSSSIITNFCNSLQSIGSDFGAHDSETNSSQTEFYQPTSMTVNSLIFALKDIIRWIDKEM